jgi:hypothetical protein
MKKIALAALLLILTAAPAFAQNKSEPKPVKAVPSNCLPLDVRPECQNGIFAPGGVAAGLQPTGNLNKDLQALWQKIVTASNADLQYASALAGSANTNSSKVRKQCFDAILTLNQQANGANLKNADGMAEVIDNLSPQGPLFTSCAGAAQLARTSTLQFISAVVTGVAGVTAIAPVIP